MTKKIVALGLWSSIFLFPLMSLADNSIIDPLNPDVTVTPLPPGNYDQTVESDSEPMEEKPKEKPKEEPKEEPKKEQKEEPATSEEPKVAEKVVEKKQEPRKKQKFDKYFFEKDIALSHNNDVIPNGDDDVPNTVFSEILGSCSGRLLFGRS